jgi:hypothetical protein
MWLSSDKWPSVSGTTWAPDHRGAAQLVCLRASAVSATRFVTLPTVEDARRIDAERRGRPCSEHCEGRHLVVWAEPGRMHFEPGRFDQPVVPLDRAAAFAAAGYAPPVGATSDSIASRWPTPSILNGPLR